MTEFVDLEAARARGGLRLVILARTPSPWSEAARGLFHVKRLPFVAVRHWPPGPELMAWTRGHNAPAALYDDEPALTGWDEILALAERLAPQPALVPGGAERIELLGLAHELLSVGGVAWNARALLIEAGLASGGKHGFPLRIAQFLAPKYQARGPTFELTRTRLLESLELLAQRLAKNSEAGPYYFGDRFTALDIYSAAALHVIAPLPAHYCPEGQMLRPAFEWLQAELGAGIPRRLLEHRLLVYERHLELPIQL
jgi:glutathione S-transferase